MNRTQRLRKYRQRRAHALRLDRADVTKLPIEVVAQLPEDRFDSVEAPQTSRFGLPIPWRTERGKCPVCGRSEKLTRAGVLGKHGDCAGAGESPV